MSSVGFHSLLIALRPALAIRVAACITILLEELVVPR
jgi:hypothetical protein